MPFSRVKIDPLDWGFLVGDCVFDVARNFNGKSFRMRVHIDRLYRSLKYVRIDPGLSPDEMERIRAGAQRTVRPPSTGSATPVMNDASSEARKSSARATSSGRPGRPRGQARFQAANASSL